MKAMEPWLRERVTDERFWDGEYDPSHVGEYDVPVMTKSESAAMFERYGKMPSLLENIGKGRESG